jgi:hypothetical protein
MQCWDCLDETSQHLGPAEPPFLSRTQEAAATACGPKCVLLLQRRLDEAEPLTLSRAVYSLYRLKVYDQVDRGIGGGKGPWQCRVSTWLVLGDEGWELRLGCEAAVALCSLCH